MRVARRDMRHAVHISIISIGILGVMGGCGKSDSESAGAADTNGGSQTKVYSVHDDNLMISADAVQNLDADHAIGEILLSGTKAYSQFNEELIVRDFFRDKRNGFFVDVGCYRPIRLSTTYYLEKHLGWTGIGIDALPEFGPAWKEHRPNSVFVSYAVTEKSGDTLTFYRAVEPGVSSLDAEVVRQWNGPEPVEVEVKTITLNDLLTQHGVTEIDFLSMDIEGAEPNALRGFDIEKFRPKLVCVEAHASIESEMFLLEYFQKHGYARIEDYLEHDDRNWWFMPRSGQ